MIATADRKTQRVRCAIYTRKSNDEGLDQDFNSLDAQREAAESFIASQRHEGWTVLAKQYNDGGYSGGTMDRPALQQLLADIEAGRIDCVTVYKVDRLSRSLLDFARLIDLFDRHKVAFVSVTQQFNTSTPMGRLVLNILLSFAQFERELCGERIRDKKAAAARKGKYIGGGAILGYDIDHENRKLIINPAEAEIVRDIFSRFTQLSSSLLVAREFNGRGVTTKSLTTKAGKVHPGRAWNSPRVYRLLTNPKYVGDIVHKGQVYPGEHEPIIDRRTWDKVQKMLAEKGKARGSDTRRKTAAMLKGLVRCGHCGKAMGITFTVRHGRQYRYYLCGKAGKSGYDACPVRSVAAGEIEAAVMRQLQDVFTSPEMIARTHRSAVAGAKIDAALAGSPPTEAEVAASLRDIGPVWNELFPREQERIVKLLVEKVVVFEDKIEVVIRSAGLHSLVVEMGTKNEEAAQ